MQNHKAELFSSLIMKFKHIFITTVGVGLDHHHVVVVQQSHYQSLVHLYVQLAGLGHNRLAECLVSHQR